MTDDRSRDRADAPLDVADRLPGWLRTPAGVVALVLLCGIALFTAGVRIGSAAAGAGRPGTVAVILVALAILCVSVVGVGVAVDRRSRARS